MWWISYRGESKHGIDNIGVFEDAVPRARSIRWSLIHRRLLIRCTSRADSRSWATTSTSRMRGAKIAHIARYHRRGDTFHFKEMLAKTGHFAGMVHPFDVELGDDGRIYVSSQDTNTVLAFVAATRKPAAVAAHLRKHYPKGKFLPGTLVASSHGRLPHTATASQKTCRPTSASRWC